MRMREANVVDVFVYGMNWPELQVIEKMGLLLSKRCECNGDTFCYQGQCMCGDICCD
jgi:hypothetical protein